MQKIKAKTEADVELAEERNRSGLKYLRKNNLPKAETNFHEAISLNPNNGAAHNNLGKVYLLQRQHYLAANEFDRASQLMPNRFEPILNLGLVYENVERFREAETYYQVAYELAPANPEVLSHYARVRVRQQIYDALTRHLLESLVFNDNRQSWIEWAKLLLGTKKFDGLYYQDTQGVESLPVEMQILPSGLPFEPPRIEFLPNGQSPTLEQLPPPAQSSAVPSTQTIQVAPPLHVSRSLPTQPTPPWMVPTPQVNPHQYQQTAVEHQSVIPAGYQAPAPSLEGNRR